MPRGVDTGKVQAEAEGRESSEAAGSGRRKLAGSLPGRGGAEQWSREGAAWGAHKRTEPDRRRPEERAGPERERHAGAERLDVQYSDDRAKRTSSELCGGGERRAAGRTPGIWASALGAKELHFLSSCLYLACVLAPFSGISTPLPS